MKKNFSVFHYNDDNVSVYGSHYRMDSADWSHSHMPSRNDIFVVHLH